MPVMTWWPRLADVTKLWLIAHNGEAVPDDVVEAIGRAGGPSRSDPAWEHDETGARVWNDAVVDEIEAIANGEDVD